MLAVVIVLAVTNLVTAAVVVALVRRRIAWSRGHSAADPQVAEALAAASRPGGIDSSGVRVRRVISIEILNPVELAGVRGRWFGIAGSLAPHLTRRIVYDQTVRQLREQLVANQVVADVRIHVLASDPGTPLEQHAANPTVL